MYALWLIAIPLFDTVNLLIKRPLQGISPVTLGTDHLHHNLLSRGYTVEQVVAILVGASLVLGMIGLAGFFLGANDSSMFQLFAALFIVYFIFSDRIKPS